MYKYKAFGLNIHSEIFLPELVLHESENPDLTIKYGNFDIHSGDTIIEGKNFRVTENTIYRFWDNIGKFKIINGNKIFVNTNLEVNDLLLRSFILGTVMSSLLYQKRLFLLHASAVNINNEVVAFLGNKGCGKSTTAMTFYREGYSIIADDYIVIDTKENIPLIYPGFPCLRLSYKSRTNGNFSLEKFYYNDQEIDKIHVRADDNFSFNVLPLKKLYVLKRGNIPKISDLKTQEALMKLVENTFGIMRFEKRDLPINLNQCASLLNNVDISLLEIPESLNEMYKVVKLVKKDLKHYK